jgi:hypothetical protein
MYCFILFIKYCFIKNLTWIVMLLLLRQSRGLTITKTMHKYGLNCGCIRRIVKSNTIELFWLVSIWRFVEGIYINQKCCMWMYLWIIISICTCVCVHVCVQCVFGDKRCNHIAIQAYIYMLTCSYVERNTTLKCHSKATRTECLCRALQQR